MTTRQTKLDGDIHLVEQARDGSREALAQLVTRHQHSVRWLVGRYFRDAETVDDIAQEVFCDAMTHLHQLDDLSAFPGWLLSMARHKSISHLRKITRRNRSTGDVDWQLIQSREDAPWATVLEEEQSESALRALRQCIGQLQPKQQSLIHGFYFRELSSRQIAQNSDVQDSAIRASLFRIRRALKKCLQSKLGVEGSS